MTVTGLWKQQSNSFGDKLGWEIYGIQNNAERNAEDAPTKMTVKCKESATCQVEKDVYTLIQDLLWTDWRNEMALLVNKMTLQSSRSLSLPDEKDSTKYCDE